MSAWPAEPPATDHEDEGPFRCERPSRSFYWQLVDGRLVPLRCGAPNRCAYCAWVTAVENSLVVGMDAQWRQPRVGMTLTTHRPDFDLDRFRTGVAQVFKWLRAMGEDVQYCGLMEWTTGKGGHGRMPHMHGLVKGLDPARCPDLEPKLSAKWEAITGGAWVVDLRELRSAGGAIAYMVGHHHKREQAPPPGFTGKRMRPSRGYFERPVAELREKARAAMHSKRAEQAALARLVSLDAPDELRDQLLDELLFQAEHAEPPRLVQRDRRTGEVTLMPTNRRASDEAPRWRSWVTVGAPYA